MGNNIKLYVKWRIIDEVSTTSLTEAMMDVNMNSVTFYQWVGSPNQVGDEIFSKPIASFKKIYNNLLADNVQYINFFKDIKDYDIQEKLKTAYILFENNGIGKCRVMVDEQVATGEQTHYFICLQYEKGGNFDHDIKELEETLDLNYVHSMKDADMVNLPRIINNFNYPIYYKYKNDKTLNKGYITLEEQMFNLQKRNSPNDIVNIDAGGIYRNIKDCEISYPYSPGSVKKETSSECCFNFKKVEYKGEVNPKEITICSYNTMTQDFCIFEARQLIKEFKYHCYLMNGQFSKLQTIINVREFNEIVKKAAPSMEKALEQVAKNLQEPAEFFAKGPMNSAAVEVGQKDMREIQAEMLENSLDKLSEVDTQEEQKFEFPDSDTQITLAQKAIIESAVADIATNLSNQQIYLKEQLPDDLFPVPKTMDQIAIRDAVCEAQIDMLNSLKDIGNLQPLLSPTAEQDIAVGLASVITGAYQEYQAKRNKLSEIETIRTASEIQDADDEMKKEIAEAVSMEVNDDAAIAFTSTFINNFQQEFQLEFLENAFDELKIPAASSEDLKELIEDFAANNNSDEENSTNENDNDTNDGENSDGENSNQKSSEKGKQGGSGKDLKEKKDNMKQKLAHLSKMDPTKLGDMMAQFMRDNTDKYTKNVVDAARQQGQEAIKRIAGKAAAKAKKRILDDIAAKQMPVSAALEQSFSGMSDKLAKEAGQLMSVDPASAANAFDSIPKFPAHENFEENFGEKSKTEPSLADKLKHAQEQQANSNTFLLDAQDVPVCKIDDKQFLKKNPDESYSYSNAQTGDKITFKLNEGELLDCNAFAKDPISKIFHTAKVLEESISATTSQYLAQQVAERVDESSESVNAKKETGENARKANQLQQRLQENYDGIKYKFNGKEQENKRVEKLMNNDDSQQRLEKLNTASALQKQKKDGLNFKQLFDVSPVIEDCKNPPCNPLKKGIDIQVSEKNPRDGDNLIVGIPTFTNTRKWEKQAQEQLQEQPEEQRFNEKYQKQNDVNQTHYGSSLVNMNRFKNTLLHLSEGNDLVNTDKNKGNGSGSDCNGKPANQPAQPQVRAPYNETECKTTGKNCGVLEQKQDFGTAPNPENVGSQNNNTNVNNLNSITTHNTINIVENMETNNFDENHHTSEIQNHYIYQQNEYSQFTGGLLIDKVKLLHVNLDRDCETCVRNQRLQETQNENH